MQQLLMGTTDASSVDVKAIVKHLNSKEEAERQRATTALQNMGPEVVETLMSFLAEENRKWRLRRRWTIGSLAGGAGFLLLVGLITGNFEAFSHVCSFVAILGGLFAVSDQQKDTTKALTLLNDKRIVGVLAEALAYDEKKLVAAVRDKLVQMLPILQVSDAALLNETQRAALHKELMGKRADVTLAILKAFEQVGDSKLLPNVEKLARGEGHTAKETQVRKEAQHCLEFLQARAEQERQRQTLLRPAMAGETAPEELLRPAAGGLATDPELLLRAAEKENENDYAHSTSL
jgi:hypothetical protein